MFIAFSLERLSLIHSESVIQQIIIEISVLFNQQDTKIQILCLINVEL